MAIWIGVGYLVCSLVVTRIMTRVAYYSPDEPMDLADSLGFGVCCGALWPITILVLIGMKGRRFVRWVLVGSPPKRQIGKRIEELEKELLP